MLNCKLQISGLKDFNVLCYLLNDL